MKIMSVDPGITTGIFFFDTVTEEKWGKDIGVEDITCIVADFAPNILIVERKPRNEQWSEDLRTQYNNITIILAGCYNYELKLITPGIWKPVVKAMKWKVTGVSQHIKDAYNLLRYAVLIYLNREMEDYNVKG